MSHPSQTSQTRRVGELTSRRLGDYQVGEVLTASGMATLYRGLDPPRGREVAIKVVPLSEATNPERMRRFRVEAHRMQTVRHPQVVPLEAFGEVEGALYLVMPLYPASLRDHLERYGSSSPQRAAHVALQVASALRGMHARGFVHRDVKPEHILLNERGDACLADLGTAREISELQQPDVTWTRSSSGLPVGTPAYMAPEQVRGEPADQRVDVYGLGAVLYEMLTGRAIYVAQTPWAVAALALQQPITPPSSLVPHIWPTLERVVLRALAREACDRYPDMASFEEALLQALGVMDMELDVHEEQGDEWVDTTGRPTTLLPTPASDPPPTPAPGPSTDDLSASPEVACDLISPSLPPHLAMARPPRPGRTGGPLRLRMTLDAVRALLSGAAQGGRGVRQLSRAIWVGARRQLKQARASAVRARQSVQTAWCACISSLARWRAR